MKKTRKMLAMLLSMMLVAVVAIGGTYAYLTSTTGVVKNTFTVGNVNITLDEAKVGVYGDAVEGAARVTENTYKLIPGHSYTKDPTVHVTAGSEKCWVFVKVVNGIASIEADTKIAAQMNTNKWVALPGVENVYYYETAVDARNEQVNLPVFGTFTLTGTADVAAYTGKTITVQAYAVQADGFGTAAAAWKDAPLAAWVPAPQA